MGARHSHETKVPSEADKTRKNANIPSSPRVLSRNRANSSSITTWIHPNVNVESAYDLHETIAYGYLGEVHVCCKRRAHHSNHTGDPIILHNVLSQSERTANSLSSESSSKGSYHRLYACKHICKSRLQRNDDVENLMMQRLSQLYDLAAHHHHHHPNIATPLHVYTTKRHVWLISDLCTGGDLLSRMDSMTELHAVQVLDQVCNALVFLHSRYVSHSNLKLENVLYEHGGSNAEIKLVDFGLSKWFGALQDIRNVCGVEYASAPEVVIDPTTNRHDEFSPSCDIWSMGVIAYYLLSGGTYPFGTDSSVDIERLQAGSFDLDECTASELARQFVTKCLQVDPTKRWTAPQALEFIKKWMITLQEIEKSACSHDDHDETTIALAPSASLSLRGIQGFGLHGQRRKRILAHFAIKFSKAQLLQLNQVFVDYDVNATGVLTIQQVKRAVKQFAKQEETLYLSKEERKVMFKGSHQDRDVSIEYEPFLDAVLQLKGFMLHERLGEALDRASDPNDDTGWLKTAQLERILEQHGCDAEHVAALLKECEQKDGMVEYDAFLDRFFQDPAKVTSHIS